MTELETLNNSFKPNPGSRMDALSKQDENISEEYGSPEEDLGLPVVAVKLAVAEWVSFSTVTLSAANPYMMLLPKDQYRQMAAILTTVNPIYVTNSLNNAQNIAAYIAGGGTAIQSGGFYLPALNGIDLNMRDIVYGVAATTASLTPVSIMVQRFAK
jgi:hypothetical protein